MDVNNNRYYIKNMYVDNIGQFTYSEDNKYAVLRTSSSIEDVPSRKFYLYEWNITTNKLELTNINDFEFIYDTYYYYNISNNKVVRIFRTSNRYINDGTQYVLGRDHNNKPLKSYYANFDIRLEDSDNVEFKISDIRPMRLVKNVHNSSYLNVNTQQPMKIQVQEDLYVYTELFPGIYFNNVLYDIALKTDPNLDKIVNLKYRKMTAMKNEYNNITYNFEYNSTNIPLVNHQGNIIINDDMLIHKDYIYSIDGNDTFPPLGNDSNGYFIEFNGIKYRNFIVGNRDKYLNGVYVGYEMD